MKLLSGKEFAAAVFSPLAAGPGMFISMLVSEPETLIHQEWWVTLVQPFYFILLALPISGLGMVLAGIPLYLVLKFAKLNYPWLVAIFGGPVGYGVFVLLGGGEGHLGQMFGVSGLAVSACAALIIRSGKKSNNSFERDAGANAPRPSS
jgi:hypothetical protein